MRNSFRTMLTLLLIVGMVCGCEAAAPTMQQVAPFVPPLAAGAAALGGPATVAALLTVAIVGGLIAAIWPTGSPQPSEVPVDATVVEVELTEVGQFALAAATAEELTFTAMAKARVKETATEKIGAVDMGGWRVDYSIRCNPKTKRATVTLHQVQGPNKVKIGETVEILRPDGCKDLSADKDEVKAILKEAIVQNKTVQKLLQALLDFLG